jgi:glycosyltransferase involved in cell wall biosynthesis
MKVGFIGPDYHTKLIRSQLEKRGVQTTILERDNINLSELRGLDVIHAIYAFHDVPMVILSKLFGKKVLCHWIGSDVLSLNNLFYRLQATVLNLFVDRHIAGSENLSFELKKFRITSDVVPIVPEMFAGKLKPLPKQFSILAYLPSNRYELYNAKDIIKLAEQMHNTRFFIVGTNGENLPKLKNVTYLGWVKMETLYPKVTVLLRIPKHDGMSLMVLEALSAGRYVVYSNPFPFCHDFVDINETKLYINKLKQTNKPNIGGYHFVKANFSADKIIKKIIDIYKNMLKYKR